MKLLDLIKIKQNNTILIIGEIQMIQTTHKKINTNFKDSIGVIGLNSYYGINHIKDLDYCRFKK